VLLVIDEVISFRLSTGGLEELYGVRPDLVTLGKIIGGGFPVGAFGGRADLMSVFDPAMEGRAEHGGTFTANPVTMRAGATALDLLDAGAIARIDSLGDRLRDALASLGYGVAGRGSLLHISDGDPDDLWWRCYEAGILIGGHGLASISTPMDEGTVDDLVERFARVRKPHRP
jgi:glutamate-1-semialdehyde 2,1-aminomutase